MNTTMNTLNNLKLNLLAELIFSQYGIRIKNYKNKNIFLPTNPNFFQEITLNTHIIFLGLIKLNIFIVRWRMHRMYISDLYRASTASIDGWRPSD